MEYIVSYFFHTLWTPPPVRHLFSHVAVSRVAVSSLCIVTTVAADDVTNVQNIQGGPKK